MKRLMRLGALMAATLLSAQAGAATLLTNSAGKLIGADGVLIEGVSYNVRFVEGTCSGLFSGCNQTSDFTFKTETSARAAGQALLNQVFLDVPALGLFDSKPGLTFGCKDNSTFCYSYIPYSVPNPQLDYWLGVKVENGTVNDLIQSPVTIGNEDTFDEKFKVFVQFMAGGGSGENPDGGSAVPEPSTWMTMILGFGLVGGAMRKSRRKGLPRLAAA